MSTHPTRVDNPFATRFTRPGALEFLFPADCNLEQTLDRLENHQWCGQIIGEHGTGKSTLVALLVSACQDRGKRVIHTTLTAGQNQIPAAIDVRDIDSTTLIVIDGFEQLTWARRRWLKQQIKARSAGLLITAHCDLGLPTILTTIPSWDSFRHIATQLLDRGSFPLSEEEIRTSYELCAGNARDALFRLYDLYELKRAKQQ